MHADPIVTVFPKERFQEFDWSRLAIEPPGSGAWSVGCGGVGCLDGDWHITIILNDGLDREIWVMPDALQQILKTMEDVGKDRLKRAFASHLSHLFELAGIELP